MKSGIYKIVNTINNNIYIGSAINFKVRWNNHKNKLNKNCHVNLHLQNAWNKYGYQKFKFEVIEECEKNILIQREQYWLDTLKPEYNIQITAGSNFGLKFSDEHKTKISLKLKNRKFSKETKIKISLAKTGVKRIISAEHRAALSKAMKGNKNNKNAVFTLESKEKIRNSLLGNKRRKKYAEAELKDGVVIKVK